MPSTWRGPTWFPTEEEEGGWPFYVVTSITQRPTSALTIGVALNTGFLPVPAGELAARLADATEAIPAPRPCLGIDGDPAWGTAELAEAVALELRARGRAAAVVSTRWWWRPAALRLELGREDVDMLRHGWVDAAGLRRELITPWRADGRWLPRLRDPLVDHSLRDPRQPVPERGVLVVHGPFLLDLELDLDLRIALAVSAGTVARTLPPDRAWWAEAFAGYERAQRPFERAEVVVSYDHPRSPALRRQ